MSIGSDTVTDGGVPARFAIWKDSGRMHLVSPQIRSGHLAFLVLAGLASAQKR